MQKTEQRTEKKQNKDAGRTNVQHWWIFSDRGDTIRYTQKDNSCKRRETQKYNDKKSKGKCVNGRKIVRSRWTECYEE